MAIRTQGFDFVYRLGPSTSQIQRWKVQPIYPAHTRNGLGFFCMWPFGWMVDDYTVSIKVQVHSCCGSRDEILNEVVPFLRAL